MLAHDDGFVYGLIVSERPKGEVRWCNNVTAPPPFLSLWKAERLHRSPLTWQPMDDKDCYLVSPPDDIRVLESRRGAELLRNVPRNQRLEVIENRQYHMALKMEPGRRVAILLKSLKEASYVELGDPLRELKIGVVDRIENGMVHIKLVTNRAAISTPYSINKIREDPMHPLISPPKEMRNFLEDPTFCEEHQLNINDRLVFIEGDNRLVRGTLLWAGRLPPQSHIEVLIATDTFMGYPHHNFYKYYRLIKINPDYVIRVPLDGVIRESVLEDGPDNFDSVQQQPLNTFYAVPKSSEPAARVFANHAPGDSPNDLEPGSLVIGPDFNGVLRWKGRSQRGVWFGGVETDQFHEGRCRGEFEGEFRFSCDPGFARFVPLSQLHLDSRFLDGQEGIVLNLNQRMTTEKPRKPPIDSSEDDDSSSDEANDPYYRQPPAPVLSPHRVTAEAPDSPLNIYRSVNVSPEHLAGVINNVEKSNRRPSPVVEPKPPKPLPRSPPVTSNSHNPVTDFPPPVPARPSDFGGAIDPNANRELRAGETVHLVAEPRVKGQVRWFGEDRTYRFPVIGIELFKPHPKASSGLFDGLQRFHTQPQHALFVPAADVVRLPTASESGSPSPGAKDRDPALQPTPDVPGEVRPVRQRDFRRLVGRNRGIQGDWNSCYLDAILFSLFSFSSAVDSVLFRARDASDIEEFQQVQTCLKEGIVNPLRSQFYVRACKVMQLRKILGQLTLKKDMCYSQKDIEELFGILMEKTLKMEPLIRLSSGEKTNMYQIFLESKVGIPAVPETQTLLELSLACSNIKFLEEPALLLMLMPRFSAEDQLFQMIIPSPQIELSNCVVGYPHKCCNCKNRADRECLDCLYDIDNVPSMESTFQCGECFKKLHEFDKTHTPRTYTVSDEFRRMHKPQPMRLLLTAVICIRHSHYVSFVRAGDRATSPWVFFDSMFERKEGSHYTPCVREVNVNTWVDAARKAVSADRSTADFNLTASVEASEVDFAERLFHDAYMCVYQSPNASIYK